VAYCACCGPCPWPCGSLRTLGTRLLHRTTHKVRLRVDMPSGLARLHVIPRLPEFLKKRPQIKIELSSTDRLVDPIAEGFDCVLRAGAPRDQQLIA
jgi:DNA-binding transcriptional LysR family regulator